MVAETSPDYLICLLLYLTTQELDFNRVKSFQRNALTSEFNHKWFQSKGKTQKSCLGLRSSCLRIFLWHSSVFMKFSRTFKLIFLPIAQHRIFLKVPMALFLQDKIHFRTTSNEVLAFIVARIPETQETGMPVYLKINCSLQCQ